MKSIFSGSAILVSTLLLSFLLISATPSLAETLFTNLQKQAASLQDQTQTKGSDEIDADVAKANAAKISTVETASKPKDNNPARPIPDGEGVHYIATAYSLRGRTASGRYVSQGIIAADPRVLPLGSRVRLEAGAWSGEYLVADTGGAIRGRKIDIWTPTSREAMRFGRRRVKLTVLSYPPKRASKKRV